MPLFLPAPPRRRWCVAGVCGNRARVPATTPATRTAEVLQPPAGWAGMAGPS
ncbi:CGNR zinc finger domain-containing protein [Streptomyces erythrochromogenes]|uniref:CGNR zinc finger domain-containing protein n=1 Tax=Streptomyces erythrochromogenes TaxID=285574 RepID=UPI003681C4C7